MRNDKGLSKILTITTLFCLFIIPNLILNYNSNLVKNNLNITENENDFVDFENPYSQIQFLPNQTNVYPYIWQNLNLTGDTNASIAILSSGIDGSHIKFGNDCYEEKNFTKKIIGWKDFTYDNFSSPKDPNGLGTFISGIIGAENETDVPTDSFGRISTSIYRDYYHPNLFEQWMSRGFYIVKIASFYLDKPNTNISINGTFYEHQNNYLQTQNKNTFVIYFNGTLVYETSFITNEEYINTEYNITNNLGMYDIGFKYFLDIFNPANFSIHCILNFTLEKGCEAVTNLTGLSPYIKLVGLKTLDKNLNGNYSQLISALNWINSNIDEYHIIATVISLGNYIDSYSDEINNVINNLISNGVMVIIPIGDEGIKSNSIYSIAQNSKALVVGSINEKNQLTYYTSSGKTLDNGVIKPDILAPGGSLVPSLRYILGLDSNENDLFGTLDDAIKNDTTLYASTSISAGVIAAFYNLLIESLGGYNSWKLIRNETMVLLLKSILLMTACETNQPREDNPYTIINESSAKYSPVLNRGIKDLQEGYGIVNIDAAIDALIKNISTGTKYYAELISPNNAINGQHVYARKILLEQNKSYLFNLTHYSSADIDLHLYKFGAEINGEPILLKSSNKSGNYNESFIFGTIEPTSEYVVVVKCINGGYVNFSLEISELQNNYIPSLTNPYVNGTQGYNDTLDIIEFSINYIDYDNTPPLNIYIHIDHPLFPSNITLNQHNLNDNNYSDGCVFSTNIRFYSSGVYNYCYVAFDGMNYVRFPENGYLNITINQLSNEVVADYELDFYNISKWNFEPWWGIYLQNSSVDNRGSEYQSYWPMLYFGDPISILNAKYNYSSIGYAGSFYVYSPQIYIEPNSSPMLLLGYRISCNINDYFTIEFRVNRTGGWKILESYTNTEFDWEFKTFNLSSYSNNYIQIRFGAIIDNFTENYKNKGFMIGYFKMSKNTIVDNNIPYLSNFSINPSVGIKYNTFQYSFIFGDNDGIPPEVVYIEIDGKNRTMLNIYGDFNASYVLDGTELVRGGIFYTYNICLVEIQNSSFIIHLKSQGKWYSSSTHLGPIYLIPNKGIYPLIDSGNKMIPFGTPEPNPTTVWLDSANSIHFIKNENVWYFGQYDNLGYGLNWNLNLISSYVYIPTIEEEEYSIILSIEHRLIFDPSIPYLANENASIFISTNGQNWTLLGQFKNGNNIENFTRIKYNLNAYRGKNILIKFNFQSDQYILGSSQGCGWWIRNISINFDSEEDHIPPIIQINNLKQNDVISGLFKLNFSIYDNGSGVDYKRISVYIGFKKLSGIIIQDNYAIINIDTSKFDNGEHSLTIFAYDIDGNQAKYTMNFQIINTISRSNLILIILIGTIIISIILFISYKYYLKYQEERKFVKRIFESKIYSGMENQEFIEQSKLTKKQMKAIRKNEQKLNELKIREEAENATPESESKKPFILYCKRCKKWYQAWNFEWICPECKSDSLFVAYQCKLCKKWYFKSEPGTYYCKKRNCKIKLLK